MAISGRCKKMGHDKYFKNNIYDANYPIVFFGEIIVV
jgi:hypothetical protein